MPTLPPPRRRPRVPDPHEWAVGQLRFEGEQMREEVLREHALQRERREWARIEAAERAEQAQRQQEEAARRWIEGLLDRGDR